jgi:hypothetical protein
MKKPSVFLLLFILLPIAAFAQTAGFLDEVLEAPQVTFGQAAKIVLPAAGLLDPEAGTEAAFTAARAAFPRWAAVDAPISLGELSHLVMRSFGLSGGFMYALFPGPRYAYRALAWRRFLPVRADPYRTVSGEELLYITGQALSHRGEEAPAFALPEPLRAGQGQGLSSGSEGVLPYRGEFESE